MTTHTTSSGIGRAARTAKPVLVIGAGPAGLAVAAELDRLGVRTEILERGATVASAWRLRYDRLRLNTCRWNSTLAGARFPKGTPLFPGRDDLVQYLESYVKRRNLAVRFGVQVNRIDWRADQWALSTSAGEWIARQVIVAIGYQHTPRLPDWPGAKLYPGRILHSAEYRNPGIFRGADVLVIGAGCSGMDVAGDLAYGGAARVRVAVRTQPNILLRSSGRVPNDLLASVLLRLPPQAADRAAQFLRWKTIGDLTPWGLTPSKDGIFTGIRRDGKVPTIVDEAVIAAIKVGKIEIVANVLSLDQDGVRLADGTTLQPEAIIAATGYSPGLRPIVGHLGVLDTRGLPQVHGGPAVAPGLHFLGYVQTISNMRHEARRVAQHVSQEMQALP